LQRFSHRSAKKYATSNDERISADCRRFYVAIEGVESAADAFQMASYMSAVETYSSVSLETLARLFLAEGANLAQEYAALYLCCIQAQGGIVPIRETAARAVHVAADFSAV
jgi:hypothetical protein